MISAKWMRFDERTNAIDYLEKCLFFIKTADKKKQNWKWVIITLHSALYGFAISALTGYNYENVIYKTKSGKEKLIDFPESIRRIQNINFMKVNVNYKYFDVSEQQKTSIEQLHNHFRNNFEHFVPTSWSIEIHGLPIMVFECIETIKSLLCYSDISFRLRKSEIKKVRSIIYQIQKTIKKSTLFMESLKLK